MKLHEETARLQLLTENESNVKTLLDRTMTSASAAAAAEKEDLMIQLSVVGTSNY